MKPFQYIIIALFIFASTLVGMVSYGQVSYRGLGWTIDTAITSVKYTDPAGFSVFNIASPAAAKGFYIVSTGDEKIVLYDSPLQISDTLKAVKALVQTVKKLFEYCQRKDSLSQFDMYELYCKQYIDSFKINSDLFLNAASQGKTDSAYYYKGKTEAFYELSLSESAKYLNKK